MTKVYFFVICISHFGLLAPTAWAGCVNLKLKKLQNTAIAYAPEIKQFKQNEQFILCFRLEQSGYVSVWDAPPYGAVSRLYPNVLTHENSASIRAEYLFAGEDYCFGTPETFPLFFPEEQGIGKGKLSVVVTQNINDQPSLDAYDIPGKSIPRQRMAKVTKQFSLADVCGDRMWEYFPYIITK